MNYHPLIYFQPNQMVYYFTHERPKPTSEFDLKSLVQWSTRAAGEILDRADIEVSFPEGASLSFAPEYGDPRLPAGDAPHRSGKDGNQVSLRPDAGKGRARAFTAFFPTVTSNSPRAVTLAELARLAFGLDNPDRRKMAAAGDAVLEQVSLNWLSSVANGGLGSGGPGGKPAAYVPPASGGPNPYQFMIPAYLQNVIGPHEGAGAGVEVAILDTAHELHEMADAYHTWGLHGGHPLILDLLDPANLLDVKYATYETLVRLARYHVKDHEYKMADHGLFAAGIIHTLAPRATLHLIEVLNPYGVGDVISIAGGLVTAANMIAQSKSKWVVNCSLFLNSPTDSLQLDQMRALLYENAKPSMPDSQENRDLYELLTKAPDDFKNWLLGNQGGLIEAICNHLYHLGSRVIAAAGNDNGQAGVVDRPAARYPALATLVLGVGALKKGPVRPTVPASYSNIADNPSVVGISTFGGEAGENGVLGMYIGEFPSGARNSNGWGWWCGTSFATPIVSGVAAAVLSGPAGYAVAENAIEQLYDPNPANHTVDLENIMPVTQQVAQGFI